MTVKRISKLYFKKKFPFIGLSKHQNLEIPLGRVLDFKLWAFGFPIPETSAEKTESWNKLHGGKLYLNKDDIAEYIKPEMYEIYLDEKEKTRRVWHIK